MVDALKIIITYKEGKGTVGISKPDCDPKLSLEEGSLEEIASRVPELVKQSEAQWAENPKYPKCEIDLTPPKPAKSTASTSSQSASSKPKKAENANQPTLF